MSTSLKRLFGILIVGVALSLGIIAALPVMAEAQDMDEASMDAGQIPVENAGVATTTQPATEPQAARRVVNPGDSLWSIGQEHLGSRATPERVQEETEKIYEINRDRIGDDPNLLLVGQELLMPPAPESVPQSAEGPVEPTPPVSESTPQLVEEEPVEAEPAPDESAAVPDASEAQDAPAAREVADDNSSSFAPFANLDDTERRRLLGLGIILLTLVVAILMAWKLPMNRGGWRGAPSRGAYQDYFSNYALPTRESDQGDSDPREGASTTPGSASPETAPQVERVEATKASAGGEAPAGSDDLEQVLLPVLTNMLKDMQQWREEHGAVTQGGASDEADASDGPREAEEATREVPARRRLRLLDSPPAEHEEEHQRRNSAEVGK